MLILALVAGVATGLVIQRMLGGWAATGGSLHVLALLSASFSGSVGTALLVYLAASLWPGTAADAATRPGVLTTSCRRCQGRQFDRAGFCRTCGLPRPRYEQGADGYPRHTVNAGARWYVKVPAVLAILAVFGGGAFLATNQGLAAGPASTLPGLVISSPTPTPTRTPTTTRTATPTWTPTATWTPTRTPSPTPTETPTETPTTTPTANPTLTPTATNAITPTASPPISPTGSIPVAPPATAAAAPTLPPVAATLSPAPAQGATPLPTLPPVSPNEAPQR